MLGLKHVFRIIYIYIYVCIFPADSQEGRIVSSPQPVFNIGIRRYSSRKERKSTHQQKMHLLRKLNKLRKRTKNVNNSRPSNNNAQWPRRGSYHSENPQMLQVMLNYWRTHMYRPNWQRNQKRSIFRVSLRICWEIAEERIILRLNKGLDFKSIADWSKVWPQSWISWYGKPPTAGLPSQYSSKWAVAPEYWHGVYRFEGL